MTDRESKSTTQEQLKKKDGLGIYRALAAVCVRPSTPQTDFTVNIACRLGRESHRAHTTWHRLFQHSQ
jgi:hypothetical protein